MRKVIRFLLIGFSAMVVCMPGQAAMVTTVQVQAEQPSLGLVDIAGKRHWIEEQLVIGGVTRTNAVKRVAAMTDSQVTSLHQRIEEEPAGGNFLLIALLVLVFTEAMGYTDLVPFIRPAD